MAEERVEDGSRSYGNETHLPSLVNMGGSEVVLESVSTDQRHCRGGGWVVVVVAGPCAMFFGAWRDETALAFDLGAGIRPNTLVLYEKSISHSAFPDPNPDMFSMFFFLDIATSAPSPYARTEDTRFLPTEKGVLHISIQSKQTEIHRE